MVQFRLLNKQKKSSNIHHQPLPAKMAVGVFTSSWTAPDLAEVHSQQRFQALGSRGEIRIDQAHRG